MMAIALGFLMFQNEFLNLSKKVVIFGTLKAFLILMTSTMYLNFSPIQPLNNNNNNNNNNNGLLTV